MVEEPKSVIAYEGILYNAFNKIITMRADHPYNMYPLAVEALILALPKWRNIEKSVNEFKEKEWENIKREIDKKVEHDSKIDDRRKKTLYYDALFTFVKHKLEDAGLLLKFRRFPVGGGFEGWG